MLKHLINKDQDNIRFIHSFIVLIFNGIFNTRIDILIF